MTEPTFPSYPHTEPAFTTYPAAGEAGAPCVLLITYSSGDSSRSVEPSRSEPMSESAARAALEQLCRGESLRDVQVRDNDEVIQLSDTEVVVRSTAAFFGRNRFTRVQIGRLRHVAVKAGRDSDLR